MKSLALALLVLAPAVASAQTFDKGIVLPGLGQPIAAADVNRDGVPDLVGRFGSDLVVYLGDGTGHLRPAIHSTAGLYDLSFSNDQPSAALGDFNKDGRIDAAVLVEDGIAILTGDGTGHFSLASVVSTMTHPTNLVTADMNGDGTLDLVCITNGNEYVQVFVADGAWHFTPTASVFMESISRMVAGDFNRDGKTDVLVNSTFSATLLPGDGAGRLGSPQQVVPGIYSAAVGDFNEDGVADVLQTRDGFVGVTFGPIPSGTPRVAFDFDDSPQAGEQRGSINAVAAADVNRDGHQDAVMLDGSGTPWVAFGDGAGRFSAPVRFAAPIANESGAWTVLSADVNGDGYADVIGGMTAGDPTWGAQPGDGYVMLYGPTTADRARTTETLVTKIDGTVDSLANLLTTTSVSLDRLSTVDFSRMANLDAAVSSRASQQSVNGLATAIGDIRAGLAGLPDGSALQATIRDEAASTRSKVDAASDAATRIAIERALGDGVTVIWFMLPASQNGQLDAVREIVAESITGLEVIGVRIPKASALAFSNAEQLFMAGDYARAYKQYAQAYQALK